MLRGTCARVKRKCTATSKTDIGSDETVTVYACHSHYGHMAELQHLSLTERQKKAIALKLQQKVPRQAILDEIRDSVGETYQRIHLLETKDLHNIFRDFDLDPHKLNENDQDSVAAWIEDWEGKEGNPVLFSILQGDEAKNFKREDFILALQTPFQKRCCSLLDQMASL